jgi:hypothetical protein
MAVSDLDGVTFDCIALLVAVHVDGGRWMERRRSAFVCTFQFAFVFKHAREPGVVCEVEFLSFDKTKSRCCGTIH